MNWHFLVWFLYFWVGDSFKTNQRIGSFIVRNGRSAFAWNNKFSSSHMLGSLSSTFKLSSEGGSVRKNLHPIITAAIPLKSVNLASAPNSFSELILRPFATLQTWSREINKLLRIVCRMIFGVNYSPEQQRLLFRVFNTSIIMIVLGTIMLRVQDLVESRRFRQAMNEDIETREVRLLSTLRF